MSAARIRAELVLLVLALAVALAVPLGKVSAAPATYTFAPSGLAGGGVQNVVAYSPFRDTAGARPLLLGGDTAGIHRSLDGGRTWVPSNGGLNDRHVAALLFSSTVAGTVYAATDSAVSVSTDFGAHWTPRRGPVDFDATGRYRVNGLENPRPTGHLLAQVTSGSTTYLYAATATQGVKRSSDDGATWEQVALAGHHLRSIAVDPADADRLYVADADTGLQLSTNARADMTFAPVPGGPAVPEELTFVGTRLYVAAGAEGIYRYDGRWHARNNGIPPGSLWEAISGFVDPATGRDVLYVGCADPVSGRHTLRSVDGGASWLPLHTDAGRAMNVQEYGHATDWWAATEPDVAFYGTNFVTSDIAVDPDDPDRVLIAGRDGAYAVIQTPSGLTWWPAVHGLMATDDALALADPSLAGRVYAANSGATLLASEDNGRTFRGDGAPADAGTTGDAVALDPDGVVGRPSTVYLAASDPGTDPGTAKIFSNPDPVGNPAGWTDESLPLPDDVAALGVGHSFSGARTLLASVAGHGLYRKYGRTWSAVSGTAPFSAGEHGSFAWMPGTPVVYALDGGGIWRSRAAGASGSWTKLARASAAPDNANGLVLDPRHPGVLYVSDPELGGVARITGADTDTPRTTVLAPLSDPGPLALRGDGALLAVDRADARLLEVADPSGAAAVTAVGDAFFAENDADAISLSVGPDDFVYTASTDGGVTVAPPRGSAGQADVVAPAPPTGLAAPDRSARMVTLAWNPLSDDATVSGYQVLRDGVVIAQTTTTTSWSDTTVTPSTRYWYEVQGVDSAGNVGDPSAARSVTTPDGAPIPTPGPPPGPPAGPPPPPPPTGPTAWGSSVMPYDGESYSQAFDRVRRELAPEIIRFYNGSGGPVWPRSTGTAPLVISFKLRPSQVLDGSHDAQLAAFFRGTPRLTYWSYWHEPEDDIARGTFTAAAYRDAWAHIAAIANASGKPLRATLVLMGYTLQASSHRTWTDYYPGSSVIDVLAWDAYAWTGNDTPESVYGPARAASARAGKAWAVAETGVSSVAIPDPARRQALLTAMSRYLATAQPAPTFVTYFDSDPAGDVAGFQGWNISRNPAAAAAWVAGTTG